MMMAIYIYYDAVFVQVSFDGSRLVFHGSMSVFIGFSRFIGWFCYCSRSVFMVFKVPGSFFMVPSWCFMVFQVPTKSISFGSRSVFMVFKVPGYLLMVLSWLLWFFIVSVRCFMVPGRFSQFLAVPDCYFQGSRSDFYSFQGSRLVFPGWLLWFFMVPVNSVFHDSRLPLDLYHGPTIPPTRPALAQ